MTPAPLNCTADLNNAAVSHLQEGNYRAAVWDLEMALQSLAPSLTIQKEVPAANEGNSTLRVKSVPIAPSSKESQNIFVFYRKAFQIVAGGGGDQHASIHSISSLLVVKFNMAIAYHDDGIRRNYRSHFVRALELYEDILYLMKDHKIKGHMVLLMAIGNNLGHIHTHFLNYSQTREALYWVRKLAIECGQHSATIPQDDYLFFYSTVVIFNGNDLNVAPAA